MKSLMTAIGAVAILNMAAMLGLAGWLFTSERLDAQRLRDVREMFTETTGQRDARLAEEGAAAAAAAEGTETLEPPLTFEQTLGLSGDGAAIVEQERQRLEQEAAQLRATLAREQTLLEAKWEKLREEQAAFDAMRARIAEIEGDEQFRKSLSLLEGVKADQAKVAVMELLTAGKRDQVIAYLDAMDERKRTKLFAEFISDGEQALAAELLEDLRTRGLSPPDP